MGDELSVGNIASGIGQFQRVRRGNLIAGIVAMGQVIKLRVWHLWGQGKNGKFTYCCYASC